MKKNEQSDFGARLRQAFGDLPNIEIANKLEVSGPAITNYMAGRIPSADTLVTISRLTNCSLHWLLTGEGPENFKGLKEQLTVAEPHFKGLKTQLAAKPQAPFQNLLKQAQAELPAPDAYGFTLAERKVIQKIADGSGISFEEAVEQLAREALFAKGIGEMPAQVAVPVFNMIDADIDARIFSYLDHLPQPTQQAETQRLIGALVTRAAAA